MLKPAFVRPRNADLRHSATHVYAVAMGTLNRFLSVLVIRQKNFKALFARVADKVVSRHMFILQNQAQGRQEAFGTILG